MGTEWEKGAHALTIHNLAYQSTLLSSARASILTHTFPSFLHRFFADFFGHPSEYPLWCVEALRSVGVDLWEGYGEEEVQGWGREGAGSQWDYADKPGGAAAAGRGNRKARRGGQ